MATEFNTQVGNGKYCLQFETDNREYYLLMQETARRCVDGKPVTNADRIRSMTDAQLVEQAISHFCYGVSHDIFSEPVATYAKLALEALERQVSKKPYWEYGGWHCKSCGLNVLSDEYFCPVCGQAIDWRDGE